MPRAVRLAPGALLGAVVAGAALLRLLTLGEQSIWFDELATVNVTSVGFPDLFAAVKSSEATPPGYYFLAKAWREILGDGATVLRLLSALCGIALVPVVFDAARTRGGPRAGVIAAALVAVSPLMVWFSQEARSYALLALLCGLTFLFLVRALDERRAIWIWAWAIASVLALATHYFAFTVIVPEAVLLVAMLRELRPRVALAGGAVLAAAAALAPVASSQASRTSWIDPIDFGQRLLQVPQHFVVGLQSPWPGLPALALGALAVVLAYLLAGAGRPTRRWAAIAGGVAGGGFLLSLLAAALGQDFLLTRNLVPLWPPFAVAVGIVLGAPRAGRVGLAAATVLIALGASVSIWTAATPAAQRPDWGALAEALGEARDSRLITGRGIGGDMLPLTLYLEGAQPAPLERVGAEEVVVIAFRDTPDYGIGPCWWGVFCGGEFDSALPSAFLREVSLPPDLPAGLRLLERGSTERLRFRRYAAREDRPLAPSTFFHPHLFQPPVGEGAG